VAIGGGGFAAYCGVRTAHTPVIVTSPVSADPRPAEVPRFTERAALAPGPVVSNEVLAATGSPPARSRAERFPMPAALASAERPATLPPWAIAPLDARSSTATPDEASAVLPQRGQELGTPLAPTTIEAETRLVRAGVAALHSRDPAHALALFDEHARKYPSGILAEERAAERVIALCGLGRYSEARAATAEFLRDHPRSPVSARLRASCAAPANP
jgi:hypothetical protein